VELKGRTLWLIGASSGIGATLAPRLAAEGAILALSARREPELKQVAESCTGATPPLVKPLDVTDRDQVEPVYRELVEAWGKVDIVFYNPGIWGESRVDRFNLDQALVQLDVLYVGLVRVVGTVMPDMVRRRSGDIVGMASLAGYAGLPRAAAYSSAKNAVIAFLQAIRIDLKRYGVGVVTVNPGFVKTPLTDRNDFRMPFLLTPEQAADQIVRSLLAGHEEIHFPRRLSWPLKLFTALPRPVYESLVRRLIARR
jgi:short-subunit dehydrogenase